jgi:tetratricopeptide (TPR) repeat protein/transcriptional regulator with XRE-family HTH domain
VLDNAVDRNGSEELASQGFGVLLRRYRLAAGLTQEELAEFSGLSARAIADIERGRTSRPYRSSVRALSAALNLSDGERELLARAAKPRGADPEPASPPGALPNSHPDAENQTRVIPRQLPPAVAHFVGRRAEMDTLKNLFSRRRGAAVVISAIAGTAGVGKTALAVHWAHQVADHFPDGQLYVNLRGYDPGDRVLATDALAALLRGLGVSGQDIPVAAEERAAHYRSLLADRQVLVILDNVHDVDQVRPLLPAGKGCAVVVTSRDSLPGLVARDGALRLELDLLPMADAVGLLTALIGTRADDDRAATQALAARCSRLPLALRIAAELTAAKPASSIAGLAAELADQQRRIDILDAGSDAHTAMRAVFSWSYRHLDPDQSTAYRLAGLHPTPDFDAYAAAALTDTSLEHAGHLLDQLARTHLIQPTRPGRYGMHDLLRAYARELATATDGDQQCHTALTRLFDYYLSATASAMAMGFQAGPRHRPRIAATSAISPEMPTEADARAWLDSERANLTAVVAYCADHGWPRHATGLADTLFCYLIPGSHLPEAHTIYSHALQASRRSGDLAAEAAALNDLGGMDIMRGHFRKAADHYQAALERFRQCGDRDGGARVLHNLGVTEVQLHNDRAAADYFRKAITAYEEAGDSLSAARALADLAAAETELGSYDEAAEHVRRALPVLRNANDQVREAGALSRIGELDLRRGQLAQAADFFEQALAICRSIDHPNGVADNLVGLGEVSMRQGEHQQAIGYLREALDLHRKCGHQFGEIMTLRCLAQALNGAGQLATARAELETALRLAGETGNIYEQANAHRDLAENYHRAAADEQARRHWRRALSLYTQLGVPEADQVRSALAQAAEATAHSNQPTS